jgi:hypothetical protein
MGGGTLHGAFEGTQGGKPSKEMLAARFRGKQGEIIHVGYSMTKIGADGRASKERHLTDHKIPKKHSNPHDHIIEWDKDGNPQFSDPINYKPGKAPKFK